MSDVELTVLLPVYNGRKYVGRAIESVLAQSFGDFEFLILDDGSHDATRQILLQCARQDPRIRLLHHKKHGAGYTLDRGIREARGALIAQIGADDLALPGRLRKQLGFLRLNPDHVVVGSYLQIVDSFDQSIGLDKCPISDEQIRNSLTVYNPMSSASIMYRRDDALACGSYTARFATCEDYDFVLRLARRGKVANIPEPLAAYRFPDHSPKAPNVKGKLRDMLKVKRAAYSEYGYHESLSALVFNLAQRALSMLPNGIAYWLLTKDFVLSDGADGATAN